MRKTLKVKIDDSWDIYVSDDCEWRVNDNFIIVVQATKTTDGTCIFKTYTYPMSNVHMFVEEERE